MNPSVDPLTLFFLHLNRLEEAHERYRNREPRDIDLETIRKLEDEVSRRSKTITQLQVRGILELYPDME
jgi:hypothetical protein